jgi:cell fate regulator YaaT (PSP1 superfamily)
LEFFNNYAKKKAINFIKNIISFDFGVILSPNKWRALMDIVYDIRLDSGLKYKARAKEDMNLNTNDWCVIRKDFYLDYGQILEKKGKLSETEDKSSYPKIQRLATVQDKGRANENVMRAKSAFRTALQQVEKSKLPMKLLNAHYSLDGKLITIQFTAEGRVDFRELVKQLSQVLNARIELRQIGVRDETAIYGGIGVCGRSLCCCSFLKEFSSINVRMAKEQDLSLTPSTISGACGRLKCCLKYEHEGYLELERTMPRRGDCCECKEGRGRIIDRNLLTQQVVVQLNDTGRTFSCSKDEMRVVYPEKYKVRGQQGKRDLPEKELDENDAEIKKLEG